MYVNDDRKRTTKMLDKDEITDTLYKRRYEEMLESFINQPPRNIVQNKSVASCDFIIINKKIEKAIIILLKILPENVRNLRC